MVEIGIEQLIEFVEPDVMILIPVLIIIGSTLKKMKIVKNWAIPFTLGIMGISISILILGFDKGFNPPVILEGILQGILCAGMSVYAHQLAIQTTAKRLRE